MPLVLAVIQPVQPRLTGYRETETCSNSPRRSDFGDDLGPPGVVLLVVQRTAGTQRLQLLEPLGDRRLRWRDARCRAADGGRRGGRRLLFGRPAHHGHYLLTHRWVGAQVDLAA